MLDLRDIRTAYVRDGFVAVDGLLDADEIEDLRAETLALVTGARGAIVGAAPAGDRTPEAVIADVLAIHFPHKASARMRAVMHHTRIVRVLTALIGPNVKAMQTMLFVKGSGQPGQAWHQDETFIPTRDRSLCGAWIALDAATVENGCLWFHPGSHGSGVLWSMRPHDDERFDSSEEAQGHPYAREGGVPLELAPGGVAFFNGYVLHRSLPNRSAGTRRAFVTHYMSAESLLPWSFGFPPRRRDDYRDIELVSGVDPYVAKGIDDEAFAFVRSRDPAGAAELFEALSAAPIRRRGPT